MAMAVVVTVSLCCFGQRTEAVHDASTMDKDGTAHISRVVPIPKTISPEAQTLLATPFPPLPRDLSLDVIKQLRVQSDAVQKQFGEDELKVYPVNVTDGIMAGVSVKTFTPLRVPPKNEDLVLINFHGGGFVLDSGSASEGIPIANLTQIKVIAVKYRLAPEFPFPAAVDDAVAVYREVLKTHKPQRIGVFGTSAGAILTAEFAMRARQLGLPLPAALGFFSGTADFSNAGDSESVFALGGLIGDPEPVYETLKDYIGQHDRKDPVLSPIYGDLKGLPPTLCITGTRDSLQSGTTIFHRALLRSGVDARLVIFEAMPHAHWVLFRLPESKEALEIMAGFFSSRLGKATE